VNPQPNRVSGDPDRVGEKASTGPAPAADAAASGHLQDLVAGLLAAVLGAAVLLYVRGFPQLPEGQPGPALFPGIIGALFVVFGLTLVLRSVLARRRAAPAGGGAHTEHTPPPTTGRGRADALAVLGSVVAYLLLVEPLGFILTMGSLLLLLMWRLGARPVTALGAAVLTTGAIVLIFEELLLVPLPPGLLG
jgi:putative tricarboxylic transport membrane protein